jgi:hypothetical protein
MGAKLMDGYDLIGGMFLIIFLFLVIYGGILLGRSMFLEALPEQKATPHSSDPKAFPKAPDAMGAFPVSIVDQEFAYLLSLLANFQPSAQQGGYGRGEQAPRGPVDYDSAIRPFKEHVMSAVNEHNSRIAEHNGKLSKFLNDATQYAVDLERRVKKV